MKTSILIKDLLSKLGPGCRGFIRRLSLKVPENAKEIPWTFSIFKDLGKNQSRSRCFTSANTDGTNPHAARACAILCGELLGYPQRLNSDYHTLTQHAILKFHQDRSCPNYPEELSKGGEKSQIWRYRSLIGLKFDILRKTENNLCSETGYEISPKPMWCFFYSSWSHCWYFS